jgi:hypothetical protein
MDILYSTNLKSFCWQKVSKEKRRKKREKTVSDEKFISLPQKIGM